MTTRVYVDRSRYEQAQRCKRARFYEYHQGGMGIVSARKPLPLAVGSSVHVGLAVLIREGQALVDQVTPVDISKREGWNAIEERAVASVLTDFAQYQNAIDVDTGEIASRNTLPANASALSEMDDYLYREQCALVEGMVRAYSRRRLRPLLEQFEVLEVEREGEWKLGDLNRYPASRGRLDSDEEEKWAELWFMSRPDALLRDRQSNQLSILSYKTAASWDLRKARDAEHDMQGLSEGIEIERRLGEWWHSLQERQNYTDTPGKSEGFAMLKYLRSCDAPPRILSVRMEYMLKGERWKDKDLSARFGVEMRSQKSHLIRAYEAVSVPMRGTAGYSIGDKCWSWEYIRDDGRDGSLAWPNWKSRVIWEGTSGHTVKDWIDKLDSAAVLMSSEDSTMGMAPRELGYKCDAQSLGVTKDHPLDAIFIPPITCYRNEDDLRDLFDQMEASERRIAEGVEAVHSTTDEGERRHALNVHFPQSRKSCEYPSTCAYAKVCYGSDDIRKDPISSGVYQIRVANHPQENQS